MLNFSKLSKNSKNSKFSKKFNFLNTTNFSLFHESDKANHSLLGLKPETTGQSFYDC